MKMKNSSDSISDALGIERTEGTEGTEGIEGKYNVRSPRVISTIPETQDEFTLTLIKNKLEDFTKVRDNIKNVISDVQDVITDAVMEVRTSPSARNYEAFCQLVQVFSNINHQLLKMYEPQSSSDKNQTLERKPINNVIFVGTNEKLIDHIKSSIR